jgi:hypothetical protein
MAKHLTAAELHLCVERILPWDLKPIAARRSIEENKHNDPTPHMAKVRRMGVSVHPLKMALETGKRWAPGKALGVQFLDGSTTQRARVRQHAEEWLSFADIKFKWNAGAKAQIRISFSADAGSWSAVGTDCLVTQYFPKKDPTMNFGWLKDETSDTEYRRVVVHEFGHALGCIHEHQNPKGGIQWNEAAVLAAFSGPPNNWSKDEIHSNIIDKYSLDQLNATKFDPNSIMLYSFPKELIKGPAALAKTGTRENTALSSLDKRFIKQMYP